MRIVGSVSGVSANVSSTKYFNVDDTIRVKHLGEKTDLNDPKFNKWFYNNISEIEILDFDIFDFKILISFNFSLYFDLSIGSCQINSSFGTSLPK